MASIGKSQGLRQNMLIVFAVFGLVIIAITFPILNASVTRMEEDLISDRLVADIHYIEDLIGNGEWNLQGNSICRGDVVVGDGTQEHANLDPFLLHEKKTGTFAYVFIRCSDEGLGYVESTPTQAGYQQGHFLRVAGSTKDPNGHSIVGTYMDKIVADILDAEGVYSGEANVAGGMIYCRYETLLDRDDNVIGAVVVGRGINELRAQISQTISAVIFAGLGAIILGSVFLFLIMNRWVNALRTSTDFLQQIETGDIPKERLSIQGLKEVDILNQGINSLADTLTENKELRIMSETDQLTGLANRFGLNHYGGEMLAACIKEKKPVSLGVLDIDYFKFFNDNYGHQNGDECIKAVAKVLQSLEEPGKVLAARYGGDEFIVITSGMDQEEVEGLADRIRTGVIAANIPHAYSKASSVVTVSQGHYVCIPNTGESISTLLAIADKVMYEVKSGARNGYKIRSMDISRSAEEMETSTPENLEDIDWSTHHDYLTQLLNGDGFFKEVATILQNNPNKEYYLVRSNIKDFKLVNQFFGYEKGNEILIETAEMLQGDRIKAEAVGRIHGDHFVFLIEDSNYDEKALRDAFLKQSRVIEGTKFILQYYVGVYRIQDKSMDVSIMCDRANIAINAMHNESELVISYYDDSMMENILRENVVISEFEDALRAGNFHVFLQPIVNREQKLVGAEALVRWIRNDGESVVSPAEFIGVLEKSGLIHKLDEYVWEEAAKLLHRWKGTPLEQLFISVNISLQDDNYLDIEQVFSRLIDQYGIMPAQLNPEFTESTLISDKRRYIDLVSTMKHEGFHVEIDDFGSGYSSLNVLNDIRADVLKLDKNFVGKTENRDRNMSILHNIIEMSKTLNMEVIAEGIETEAQFQTLSSMGCDMFQGFYFSKPISPDEFERKYLNTI